MQSQPFKFVIGSNRKDFFIHPALIADVSKPLAKLTCGSMREAKEGHATIADVDEDTFARFCEFLYTGDYHAASPIGTTNSCRVSRTPTQRRSPPSKETLPRTPDEWLFAISSKAKPAPNKLTDLWWTRFTKKAFADLEYDIDRTVRRADWNPNPEEDYSQVFLSHARLYVFAEMYDVELLRKTCLYKLHDVLMKFCLHDERVKDVARLLQYTYTHTPERKEQIDDLRFLVTRYVSMFVQHMIHDDTFQDVMDGESAAAMDLLRQLVEKESD